jgi:hypothetical protein
MLRSISKGNPWISPLPALALILRSKTQVKERQAFAGMNSARQHCCYTQMPARLPRVGSF